MPRIDVCLAKSCISAPGQLWPVLLKPVWALLQEMRREAVLLMRERWRQLVALLCLVPALHLHAQADENWIYQVQTGDSLWSITERHLLGIRWVTPLQHLNQVADPYVLEPGRDLLVPVAWTRRLPAELALESVAGEISVQAGESAQPVPATVGMRLGTGDQLLAGSDGHALLRYPDESSTQVFPDSRVRILVSEMLGEQATLRVRLAVEQGRSEHQVRPAGTLPGNDLRVIAPFATTSVRGTHFRVAVKPDEQVSLVGVLKGSVEVAPPASDATAIDLAQGQGTVAQAGNESLLAATLLPAPVLPQTLTTLERLPLLLRVPEVHGASSYGGELSLDPEYRSVVATATATGSALIFSDQLPDGEYWLRVRAIDGDGLEGLDTGARLVVNARPEPPFLTLPAPAAMLAAGRPLKFAWTGQRDARHYELELGQAAVVGQPPQPAGPPFRSDGSELSIPWSDTMDMGRFAWRVRSVAADEDRGPFGDWQEFRIVAPGPGVSPPTLTGKVLTLTWSGHDDPASTRYRFQLAREENFQQLLVDETLAEASHRLDRPRHGRYFVRVARVDAAGEQEPWGSVQELQIPRRSLAWLLGPAAVWAWILL